ncbi:MAG TPA: AMP-binding protein [Acetobacteraceae bacterium]
MIRSDNAQPSPAPHLDRRPANFSALTPLSLLARAEAGFADSIAVIAGPRRLTYRAFAERCRRLASALQQRGVGYGDTVAVFAPNVPALLEAHYGVPMLGAVLNAINTRLDAATVAHILAHGEARVLIVDRELGDVAQATLALLPAPPLVVHIDDPAFPGGRLIGALDYEEFLVEGDPDFRPVPLRDEWDAIALNYTSGTTGAPKGVLYHHRGAYLNAISNLSLLRLGHQPVYLWTLPMFHCNGWCHTWCITALAGTHVCLRRMDPAAVFALIDEHGVTHASGAPIVLNLLREAARKISRRSDHVVTFAVGGAPPQPALLEKMEALNFRIIHAYGMTETYGPALACDWKAEWNGLRLPARAALMARQGLPSYGISDLIVADPATLAPVPADARTVGEILLRGHTLMKGYHKDPAATEAAFAGGWLHTGDLAVLHPDGYVEMKDRSKDLIISGGENISSLELENVLYRHPAVLEAAVVARPDETWGETPCAFITLRPGTPATEAELTDFCRQHLAGFKMPRTFVFTDLPKTSTGKVQKHLLRQHAAGMTTRGSAPAASSIA